MVGAFLRPPTALGMVSHRVLFFDDIAENVASVRATGLLAVQAATAIDVERALNGFVEGL